MIINENAHELKKENSKYDKLSSDEIINTYFEKFIVSVKKFDKHGSDIINLDDDNVALRVKDMKGHYVCAFLTKHWGGNFTITFVEWYDEKNYDNIYNYLGV